MFLRSSDGNGVVRFRCPRNHVQIFWETVMASTQLGLNGSLAADFIRQFDQVREQTKSVFATQKELLDALEQMNAHWFARAKSEAEFCHDYGKQTRHRAVHAGDDQRLSRLVESAHAKIRRR